MKLTARGIIRALQALGLLLLLLYLMIVRQANPNTVHLPFLLPLPTEWVVGLALLLGFVVGWSSLSGRVFRLNRLNRGLRQRLIKAGLEAEPLAERTAKPRQQRHAESQP